MGEAVCHSFSKSAKTYARFSSVQDRMVQALLTPLADRFYAKVLDLGCGSGNVLKALPSLGLKVGEFVGLDISSQMLALHPTTSPNAKSVRLECGDFESVKLTQSDLAIGASSLQWADNLGKLCRHLSCCCQRVALAIHTAASLHELHAFLNTHSPLRGAKEVQDILKQSFKGFKQTMWVETFKQEFNDRESFLQQLKKGGLLGGGSLPFSKAKALKLHAPYASLSYEAIFFIGELI
ncbi:Biotin synthase BioC [Helicobacter sp. NHP19-012]|uniref:Biotin synthase BioC n=1 Tax=Helicobacter gastrofelis TaxID=2849642 RepID=A0ABM7SGJ3_9HELI|nr:MULTISPECIES: methyltransferase domain-containing protein [unclassified Helicobacter]BCZ18943.1 Biotin synthase BioC [Helicobacter sp. NHP19-012]GMB96338.1 Biotin synthase BioC [Helicobacter sp. NHP22-001]